MKTLRTRSADAGLSVTNLQLYNYFINSLPAEFPMVVTVHNPDPDYSLCERFRTTELRKGLRTAKDGGTSDDPIALLDKNKGFKDIDRSNGGSPAGKRARSGSRDPRRPKGACYRCGKRWFRGHRCAEKKEGNDTKKTPSSVDKSRPTKAAEGTLLRLIEPRNVAHHATEAGSFQ